MDGRFAIIFFGLAMRIPHADIRTRLLCTETIVYDEYHMTQASSNIPRDRGGDKTSDIPKVRCK